MRFWVPALTFALLLSARDEQQLALSLKAQTEFERVAMAALPALSDTTACAQSQSSILAVSPPEDMAMLHYRKGYCLLAAAAVTANRQDFAASAAELDQAVDAWPAR